LARAAVLAFAVPVRVALGLVRAVRLAFDLAVGFILLSAMHPPG
jgi:hypothetical protein